MDRNELNTEIEMASRLCEGADSRVVILCNGVHYEIENVIPLGVAIVLEAGEESVAPVDPMLEEEGNDPEHLRIAEDQPGQEREVGKPPEHGASYGGYAFTQDVARDLGLADPRD